MTISYGLKSLNYSFSQSVFVGQGISSYLGIISKFPQITGKLKIFIKRFGSAGWANFLAVSLRK